MQLTQIINLQEEMFSFMPRIINEGPFRTAELFRETHCDEDAVITALRLLYLSPLGGYFGPVSHKGF